MADDNKKTKQSLRKIPNNYQKNDGTFEQNMEKQDRRVNESTRSPDQRGSDSISGSTPSPSSDDDVLGNAHQMGIGIDADLESPQELNIAKDVEDAEEYRKTH